MTDKGKSVKHNWDLGSAGNHSPQSTAAETAGNSSPECKQE